MPAFDMNSTVLQEQVEGFEAQLADIHDELAVIQSLLEPYEKYGKLFEDFIEATLGPEEVRLKNRLADELDESPDQENLRRAIRGQIAEVRFLKSNPDRLRQRKSQLQAEEFDLQKQLGETRSRFSNQNGETP